MGLFCANILSKFLIKSSRELFMICINKRNYKKSELKRLKARFYVINVDRCHLVQGKLFLIATQVCWLPVRKTCEIE